eukprot:5115733-Lingulodinium_polyedra.AAC.1
MLEARAKVSVLELHSRFQVPRQFFGVRGGRQCPGGRPRQPPEPAGLGSGQPVAHQDPFAARESCPAAARAGG